MSVEFLPGVAELRVRIAPGVDRTTDVGMWPWVDITGDVRVADRIVIEDGRPGESGDVGPGRCALRLDNTSGDYSRTNPLGAYYGLLAKNTPLQVQVRGISPADATDDFARSVTGGWGASTRGGDYSLGGLGGSVVAGDWDVTGGQGTQEVPDASAYRLAYLPEKAWQHVSVRATCTVAMPTGGAVEPTLLVRGQGALDSYYMARAVIAPLGAVTAELRQVVDGVESLVASGATGVTHAAATPLHVRCEAEDDELRMRVWQGSTEPSTWHATAAATSLPDPGWVGVRSGVATGNTNAKPVVFSWDDLEVTAWHDLVVGDVPDWPARWDQSGRDATVPVAAAGIMRRLEQGASPLRSALHRQVKASEDQFTDLVAFWPLDEGANATQAGSGMTGGNPMALTGTLGFGGGAATQALPALLSLREGGGRLVGAVPAGSIDDDWRIEWVARYSGTNTGGTRQHLSWRTAGSVALWDAAADGVDAFVTATAATGVSVGSVFSSGTDVYDGRYHHYRIEAVQFGSDIVVDGYVDGVLVSTEFLSGYTLGRVTEVTVNPAGHTGSDMPDVGYVAVWAPWDFLSFIDTSVSFAGNAGELASDRVQRLCDEEGVPVTVVAGNSETVGAQPVDTLLNILRECEKATQGVLYEHPPGLGFLPHTSRYNTDVAMTLSFSQLAQPPEPADDDQRLRNDVTLTRRGGSSARYQATGGYAPDGPVGRYDEQLTVNTNLDSVLPHHAEWRVHLGTVDELRWPRLDVHLAHQTSLIPYWLACSVGSRVNVTDPPAGVPPDTVDVLIEGRRQVLGYNEWDVTVQCSPARPWQVGEVDGPGSGADPVWTLDTAGSTIVVARDSDDTSLELATSLGPEWSTSAAFADDFPMDAELGGEQVTVTALSTDTPAFVAAGAVAHGNNASVSPALPAGVTADVGQLLLIWAAIRNSGTGTVDTPTGWTTIAESGNCKLMGRHYVTGDVAPTVTFSGGVAGDDTSAQMCAFSGLSMELAGGTKTVPAYASQLNGAAANIAYPALAVVRAGGVVVWAGWKQDDWTSVTGPGDAEVGEPDTTTGDDQGLAWYYDIYTTAADQTTGSFTVTGGASAISRAVVVALRPTQTATVTRSVNGVVKSHAAGTAVRLWKPPVIALGVV